MFCIFISYNNSLLLNYIGGKIGPHLPGNRKDTSENDNK